jgi:hypothetical protein
MNDHEWALERQKELDGRKDIDAIIELTDLRGALTRIKRTSSKGGAYHVAYRRIHNWRRFHNDMLATAKAKPGLVALYQELAS